MIDVLKKAVEMHLIPYNAICGYCVTRFYDPAGAHDGFMDIVRCVGCAGKKRLIEYPSHHRKYIPVGTKGRKKGVLRCMQPRK